MSKMKHTLCYMAVLVGFAACTQDELTGDTGKGQYPLTLTATVAGGADTRATVEGTWEEGNAITLVIDERTYTYQYSAEGWVSTDPYFWPEEEAPISVSAYSFGGKATGNYAVQADQNADDGYQSSDLLYAPAVEVTHGEDAELTFYHQTAKVVVNIVEGDNVPDNPTVTIGSGNLALTGTFTLPADGNYGTWTPGTQDGSITPHSLETPNAVEGKDIAASYEALAIPQTLSTGTKLINLLIDEQTYSYTLPGNITWKPGCQYTYTITVQANGLEVSVTESIEWSTNNTGNGNLSLEDGYDKTTETYYAYTAEGLKKWAEGIQNGTISLNAKCLLFDDIDFSGSEAWTPVGSSDNGFTGTFDGQGHTISNMTIAGNQYAGMFAYINGGQVQNVEFKNIEILQNPNNQYVGVVAGYNNGTISHCQITDGTAYINNTDGSIGGIAGQNDGTISCCEVVDCILNGNKNSAYVGGIAGLNSVEGQIEACSFTDIIYAATNGGGIVGQNDGDIRACWADANFAGGGNKGGVCGKLNSGTITACYWQSSIGADKGVGSNTDGTDNTVKVEGETNWQTAVDAMNEALGADFSWQWQTSDSGTPPTLVPSN